ncbi:MAG: hypothetical protein KDB84_09200, partial [Flavobacteriales bacterium]|nr:hypothetical protein [Flavobacteriales bacterium]
FASEKYDKSDSVLRKLGIRPGKEGSGGKDDDDFGESPEDSPNKGMDQKTPEPQRGGGTDIKQPR